MQTTARRPKIIVSADGRGIVSQAGGLLLTRTLAVTGLDRGLSAGLERWRAPRAVHDPGKIIADLAVTLALGGDCLADVALLRAEPALFGPVASDPVVSRLVSRLAGDAPRSLKAIRAARAAARQKAWELAGEAAPGAGGAADRGPGRDDRDLPFGQGPGRADLEEDLRLPSPDRVRRPRPDGSGEPLAIVLRPGNAGSNTAADHIEAARLALAQLPAGQRKNVLIRADSGGGTHEFLTWLTRPSRRLQYSVGMVITAAIEDAIGTDPRRRRGPRPTTPAASSGPAPGSPS